MDGLVVHRHTRNKLSKLKRERERWGGLGWAVVGSAAVVSGSILANIREVILDRSTDVVVAMSGGPIRLPRLETQEGQERKMRWQHYIDSIIQC
jgi:hypothetical protein